MSENMVNGLNNAKSCFINGTGTLFFEKININKEQMVKKKCKENRKDREKY